MLDKISAFFAAISINGNNVISNGQHINNNIITTPSQTT
jgi:hypothetical protein